MHHGLPEGYRLRRGYGKDRALLLKFLSLTYQELFPAQGDFSHLAKTVEQYFSDNTPLWWVEAIDHLPEHQNRLIPIAGLWMGNAVDQVTGDRNAHIFLVYVTPEHRRRGIATALISYAQVWSQARGDRQIGLQVFHHNQAALHLYQNLGFSPQSLFLLKRF